MTRKAQRRTSILRRVLPEWGAYGGKGFAGTTDRRSSTGGRRSSKGRPAPLARHYGGRATGKAKRGKR